jgi:hypothetical protein
LDVYRVALDFAAWAYTVCRSLIERGNQVREQESGDANGNEEDEGRRGDSQ